VSMGRGMGGAADSDSQDDTSPGDERQ